MVKTEGIRMHTAYEEASKSLTKLAKVVDMRCPGKMIPICSGAVTFFGRDMILTDYENRTCNLNLKLHH
ncbi:hypothetical protein CHS0354_017592 [Potamilus streckersoni]|uniref:Uncharacterized protein n=1 Tax=Potamilus streckersoni TaxID=2493646 RepID=A0AAE0VGM9_9BIVA|nr:hypothetical protein CHS0354_017592 [Potamilus streckersoni]